VAAFVAVCSGLAVLVAAHVVVNARLLRRLPPAGSGARVAVLLPVRNEAHRVEPCLRALLALDGGPSIVVLDDGSTDGTGDLVRSYGIRVIDGAPLPDGWLGKPHACQQLADATDADVLVFVDADVVLAPDAVTRAAATAFDLLTPYPRIVATGPGQRLVQPLLQWSWLAFLPLRAMERSRRPSLAAAGGQFLVVRRAAYVAAGGHAAVRSKVLEDVELARAVKRAGGRIALADGSTVATCRMYDSWPELVDGYTKSLWASFGSAAGAAGVVALLLALFVAPVVLAVHAPVYGLVGYAAGVVSRVVAARSTGGRAWPDALGHPVSVLLFGWLVARSFRRRRSITWKGRRVA
jgi:cellulose synthase/poly-beta-1,6-N-acetylglucosamine synthase-like glycosyltransferase